MNKNNVVDAKLHDLLNRIVKDPVWAEDSVRELASCGRVGAEAALERMLQEWDSEADPREVIEALAHVLQLVAEDDPDVLLEMSHRDLPHDPHLILIAWSLWNAALKRRERSLSGELLENRLRELANHENELVRWAVEEGFNALDLPRA